MGMTLKRATNLLKQDDSKLQSSKEFKTFVNTNVNKNMNTYSLLFGKQNSDKTRSSYTTRFRKTLKAID